MIQKIKLLHYLTEKTYRDICIKFDLGDYNQKPANKIKEFDNEQITQIHLFNVEYKQFGHIWFLEIEIDFLKFNCNYDDFGTKLYSYYNSLFGIAIMANFPKYDELCCGYVEYSLTVKTANADMIMENLKSICKPEQLDKSLWYEFKKPNATIEFCIDSTNNEVEVLARCHGTALKKRISDVSLHRTVGLIPDAAINYDTEQAILKWLLKKHHIEAIYPL